MALVTAVEPAWQVADGETHVWVIDTSSAAFDGLDPGAYLDVEERERARRLVSDGNRAAFNRVHSALRQILAGYLAVPAHEILYEYDCVVCGRRHGKPAAVAPGTERRLPFNMARSMTLGVVAVANDGPVGIDVESLDQTVEVAEILEFFTRSERRALLAGEPRDCLTTWTRKEAYAKALGTGLSLGLDEFEVATPPDPPAVLQPAACDSTRDWAMADLPLPAPYVGTLVTAQRPRKLRMMRWDAKGGRGRHGHLGS